MRYEKLNGTHFFYNRDSETFQFDDDGRLLYFNHVDRFATFKTANESDSRDIVKGYEMRLTYGDDSTRIDYKETLENNFSGAESIRNNYAIYRPNIVKATTYEDSYGDWWEKDKCTYFLSTLPQKLKKDLELYYHTMHMNIYLVSKEGYIHDISDLDMKTVEEFGKKIQSQGDRLLLQEIYEMATQMNTDLL